jgi:hypothetical protein
MAKRHTNQNHKQKNGQFFTKNADDILSSYSNLFKGKYVIDPFAGDSDLLNFATKNGASKIEGYDIEPRDNITIRQDTLLNPPNFKGKFLLTNPPYLCSNKNKDKTVYEKYGYNDLYKCHIASFIGEVDEGILILPSNFLSESRAKIRELFFKNYTITKCDYYYYQIFPSATTGIVVFHFIRDTSEVKSFECNIHYSNDNIVKCNVTLQSKYDWLFGDEFFDYIDVESDLVFDKYTGGTVENLTNIVIGLLDKGKWTQGLSYNSGNPIVCGEKSFTTYQVISSTPIDVDTQKKMVEVFNEKMNYFREKYHGLFLSNFMGANQKILSRSFVHSMMQRVYNDVRVSDTVAAG